MARQNYSFNKRQRELAKKQKREEKRQKRLERKDGTVNETGETGEAVAETPVDQPPVAEPSPV